MTRILVVDDEPMVARSVAVQLRAMGIESVTVNTGAEALAAAAAGAFDLIISDVDMVPMNGLALLAALETRGDQVPLIFLTGLSRQEVSTRALASPLVRGVLQKPLVGAAFADTIRRALVGRLT